MNQKTEAIHYLYAEGFTYAEIAKRMGITRQRVQQIVKPPKQVVDALIQRANGKCEDCGIEPRHGHVHHIENKYVFEVADLALLAYLCPSCHRARHGREAERQSHNMRVSDETPRPSQILPADSKRCGQCNSILTYIRIKANERVCRGCGNTWKL